MHVGRLFELAARRCPDWPAIDDGARQYTYRAWFERCSALAGWLRQHGVRPGTRVALCMRNREELATAYLAIQLAGAVAVPISFRHRQRELAHCLTDSGARLLIWDDSVADVVAGLDGRCRLLHASDIEQAIAERQPGTSPGNDDSGLSVILYTAAPNGLPRGVPRTHRAESSAVFAHVLRCGYEPGERTLGALTLSHSMGLRSLLAMLLVNGLYVVAPSVTDQSAVDQMRDKRITCLFLVPTAYHLLLDAMGGTGPALPDCRKLGTGGSPISPTLAQRCVDAFDPQVFVNWYGTTEIYTLAVSGEQRTRPNCAGRPGPFGHLRVVPATRARQVQPAEHVPPGALGEVIASADADDAFAGYLNRPEENALALRDGWYFTGDLGRLDEEGDLWLEGRVDDMLITGGENVYPVEVEQVLGRHPDVADIAVCGTPDEVRGQAVTAYVAARPNRPLAPADIVRFAREQPDLAGYKRPRRVIIVPTIPRAPDGTVDRHRLQSGDVHVPPAH